MRKHLLIILLMMTFTITGLTACTKKTDTSGLTPALLEGQSEHWKVTLKYTPNGDSLDELITLQTTLVQKPLDEVTVIVNRKDQEPSSYPIAEPSLFMTGEPLTFVQKASVKSWKDTGQVEVEWKISDTRIKEYIPVENKAAGASK